MHSAKIEIFMPAGQRQILINGEQKKMEATLFKTKELSQKHTSRTEVRGSWKHRTALLIWDRKLRGEKCIFGCLWKKKKKQIRKKESDQKDGLGKDDWPHVI